MKRAVPLVLFALASWGVHSEELSASESAPAISVADMKFKPSTLTLAEAIAHSNLRKVSTNVVIAYDALGNVIGVKLEKPTGSATLDKAILAWAALVKINRDKAGFASIPIELASSE